MESFVHERKGAFLRGAHLGSFELLRDGKAIQPTGKAQRKPIELLELLLAMGGCRVPEGRLSAAVACLDERSQDIVQCLWLDETKATLQELANLYCVSAERIRQLEKNALAKLRRHLD